MNIQQIIGSIILIPSMFAMPLIGISGAILHFFTAIVAYTLAGPGLWGYVAAGGAFTLPVIAQIAVFIGAWNTTGNFINGYSEWLLLWLAGVSVLLGLMALGVWIGRSEES